MQFLMAERQAAHSNGFDETQFFISLFFYFRFVLLFFDKLYYINWKIDKRFLWTNERNVFIYFCRSMALICQSWKLFIDRRELASGWQCWWWFWFWFSSVFLVSVVVCDTSVVSSFLFECSKIFQTLIHSIRYVYVSVCQWVFFILSIKVLCFILRFGLIKSNSKLF